MLQPILRCVKNYLKKEKFSLLLWPPQSPDLNLIENVWSMMKMKLKYSYSNEQELHRELVRVWSYIEVSGIQKLYSSMRSRLEAVIKAKGGPTKY